MAKQAEAERARRAKVINAEGEFQASTKLAGAAEIIQQFPVALQLRFLQTVVEVAAENNSTTLFPIPIDLFGHFLTPGDPPSDEARPERSRPRPRRRSRRYLRNRPGGARGRSTPDALIERAHPWQTTSRLDRRTVAKEFR